VKQAIEEVKPENRNDQLGFHSTLFTIPKKTGGERPVLNLKPLNRYLPRIPFKMETMKTICNLLQKGHYMTSIDLTDAFLHVLVHETSKRYLRFHWNNNTYQFRTIPFGLSLSPMVFTKILKPVLKWARRSGIMISAYLDDLLVIGKTAAITMTNTMKVIQKLTKVGFLVNHKKSQLTPSTIIQHLGFMINTEKMTLTVPASKIRDIRRAAQKLLHQSSVKLTALTSFIGKALATSLAVFPARLHTRQLIQQANKLKHSNETSIVLTGPAKLNLQWWIQHLQQWNGHSFIPEQHRHELYTDASMSGWGIVDGLKIISGTWNQDEKLRHINYLELLVIYYIVKNPKYRGRSIQIYCDNSTVVSYINHFGGTRSQHLLDLTQVIWMECLKTNTRIKVDYVATMFNPADAPSRQQLDHQL
jgi:hypothetical protein